MQSDQSHKTFRYSTLRPSGAQREKADLIVETPLEITINEGRRIFIMFTPGMVRELMVGFLFTEGLIKAPADLLACDIRDGDAGNGDEPVRAGVTLAGDRAGEALADVPRMSFSSCGICGKENFHEMKKGLGRVKSRRRFDMEVLLSFSSMMKKFQPLYEQTGGAHAAILLDGPGNIVARGEDMGRHNALDKVIGRMLLDGIPCEDKVIVSSGRASLEMILKCARAGIPVFVAMSRPTSRAVEAARFYNITLVDMAKGSHRIYSHARRLERT